MAKVGLRKTATYTTLSGVKLESSRRRFFVSRQGRYFKEKQWTVKKAPNLTQIKSGDMLLTINTRSTPAGLKSRIVAKLGKGPYAHSATYLRKENNVHTIRDFEFMRGGKTYPLNQLAQVGVNYKVIRWVGAGGATLEKQIEAFVKNVEATKGGYDAAQLLLYSLYQNVKNEGIKKVLEKNMEKLKKWLDDPKKFTCSEAMAEGGDPYAKQIKDGTRTAVAPPLKFHPTLDKELVTPAVVHAAIAAGLVKLVTECEWEYR